MRTNLLRSAFCVFSFQWEKFSWPRVNLLIAVIRLYSCSLCGDLASLAAGHSCRLLMAYLARANVGGSQGCALDMLRLARKSGTKTSSSTGAFLSDMVFSQRAGPKSLHSLLMGALGFLIAAGMGMGVVGTSQAPCRIESDSVRLSCRHGESTPCYAVSQCWLSWGYLAVVRPRTSTF